MSQWLLAMLPIQKQKDIATQTRRYLTWQNNLLEEVLNLLKQCGSF